MGRRTNLRLDQSKPPLGQGFRSFDRQRQNLGLHRLRAAAHQEIGLPITLPIRLRFGHLDNRAKTNIGGKMKTPVWLFASIAVGLAAFQTTTASISRSFAQTTPNDCNALLV